MNDTIRQLLAQKSLSKTQSYALFATLGQANQIQQAVILSLLAAKGESFQEILGACYFLSNQCTFDQTFCEKCPPNTIDLVGTGGDGLGTQGQIMSAW